MISFLKRFYLFTFRQRGREGEREGNISVWLPLRRPLLGTWPATQTCSLTGDQTGNPLLCRPALNALSHTSQEEMASFTSWNIIITCTGKGYHPLFQIKWAPVPAAEKMPVSWPGPALAFPVRLAPPCPPCWPTATVDTHEFKWQFPSNMQLENDEM